jgi:hypothetical protein
MAVQDYLRQAITYSLDIASPPAGQDPVDWVLFDSPKGYCNYYASAMVVLLRSAGVPARMAAGFAQGAYDLDTGEFLVVESDAHAWPEVFFPGYGWVEFEPTASQPTVDRRAAFASPREPVAPEPAQPAPLLNPRPGEEDPLVAGAHGPERAGLSWQGWVWLIAAGLAALDGAWLWLRWRARRAAEVSPAATAYARLAGAARWMGQRWPAAWTPRERAAALARVLPERRAEVEGITANYELETYGRGDAAGDDALAAWRRVRRSVLPGAARAAWRRMRGLDPTSPR